MCKIELSQTCTTSAYTKSILEMQNSEFAENLCFSNPQSQDEVNVKFKHIKILFQNQ